MKAYNTTFSIMKGLAIISVVLGHCAIHPFINDFVNQYHLAVFFFVAGYFFKTKSLTNFKSYALKKVKRLYIPFITYGLVFLLLHNILCDLYIYDGKLDESEIVLGGLKLILRLVSSESLLGAMWFCPALLIVSLLSFFLFWISNRFNLSNFYLFALAFFIGWVGCSCHIKSPYCIWQSLQISAIFYSGYAFRHYQYIFSCQQKKLLFLFVSIIFIYVMTKLELYAHLQPANINNENGLIILLISCIGSIGMYCLASLLNETKAGRGISVCGNYSFSIMALHFLSFKSINAIQCLIYGYDLTMISSFPCLRLDNGWWVVYLLTGLVLPILSSYIYNKIIFYVRSCCN